MQKIAPFAIAMLALSPMAAISDVVELNQTELRHFTSQEDVIPTQRLVAGVENFSGGRVVEIRAFALDHNIAYRVLIRQASGQVASLLVDGRTGHQIPPSTDEGRQLDAAAATPPVRGDQQVANATEVPDATDNGNGRNIASNTRGDSDNRNSSGTNRNSNSRSNSNRGNNGNNGNGGNPNK